MVIDLYGHYLQWHILSGLITFLVNHDFSFYFFFFFFSSEFEISQKSLKESQFSVTFCVLDFTWGCDLNRSYLPCIFDWHENCESMLWPVLGQPAWPSVCMWLKCQCCNFLGCYKYDKCQTLHDGSIHWAFPIHTTFSDLDCISGSQQCQTVLIEHFKFLFGQVENMYYCWLRQIAHEYITIFDLRTCSREMIYIFTLFPCLE